MHIGLYGGTFDPPHNAHLKLAEWVRKTLNLEYVYFIPAAIHAFKDNSTVTPAWIRFEMVREAIKANNRFRISRIEIDRQDTSFTIDTLHQFPDFENLPESVLYYIIGYDNLAEFHSWKDYRSIFEICKVVVLRRSGRIDKQLVKKYEDDLIFLDSPCIDISATDIRKKIKNGHDISDSVPPAVLAIIRKHNLYKTGN